MHGLHSLIEHSVRISDSAMETFISHELPLLIKDERTRDELIELWRTRLRQFRTRAAEATGTRRIPMPTRKDQVLESLKLTRSTSQPRVLRQFNVRWDRLGREAGEVRDSSRPQGQSDLLAILMKDEKNSNGDHTGVPEFVLTPELIEKLGKNFAIRMYGRRLLTEGKRKRSSAYESKSGVIHITVVDGFIQLADGLIELFFKRADVTMGNFFDS
jgi:hypothetical protein